MKRAAKAVLAVLLGGSALVVWVPPAAAANSIRTFDAEGSVGAHTSMVLDSVGNPVISYYHAGPGEGILDLVHCVDPNCAAGRHLAIVDFDGTDTDVGRFTSLELDDVGNPVISYYDRENHDLKVAHCDDPNCDFGGNSIVAVDTPGDVGEYTSLELDADGNPVISYYSAGTEDLRVAHCDDPNCDVGGDSIVGVDTEGIVGEYTSLVLDANGNPVISYNDNHIITRDLKVAHCDDPNGDPGGDSTFAVDIGGAVGAFASLVLDADGNPVISYSIEGRGVRVASPSRGSMAMSTTKCVVGSSPARHSGPRTVVDLALAHPVANRLGMHTELLSDLVETAVLLITSSAPLVHEPHRTLTHLRRIRPSSPIPHGLHPSQAGSLHQTRGAPGSCSDQTVTSADADRRFERSDRTIAVSPIAG